jgi:hypothetical protein
MLQIMGHGGAHGAADHDDHCQKKQAGRGPKENALHDAATNTRDSAW